MSTTGAEPTADPAPTLPTFPTPTAYPSVLPTFPTSPTPVPTAPTPVPTQTIDVSPAKAGARQMTDVSPAKAGAQEPIAKAPPPGGPPPPRARSSTQPVPTNPPPFRANFEVLSADTDRRLGLSSPILEEFAHEIKTEDIDIDVTDVFAPITLTVVNFPDLLNEDARSCLSCDYVGPPCSSTSATGAALVRRRSFQATRSPRRRSDRCTPQAAADNWTTHRGWPNSSV